MKYFVPFDTEKQTASFVICCYWFILVHLPILSQMQRYLTKLYLSQPTNALEGSRNLSACSR